MIDKEHIKEFEIPSGKWVDYKLSQIDKSGMDHIWSMYTFSYIKQGLDLSASSASDMQRKYKATVLKDVDNDREPDAFIIYKTTPFGNKLALLGTNGKPQAKRDVVQKLVQLVNTSGWYVEASAKMEDIMRSVHAPVVTDETKIKKMIPSDKGVEFIGNGYYTRKLSLANKRIVKRIYGKPK